MSAVNQQPDSPVVRQGAALTTQTPLDANHNPGNARFSERRVQLNEGWGKETGWGEWENLLSLAYTHVELVRGYLEDPANPGPNADGFAQERKVYDLYLDSHLSRELSPAVQLVYGVDALLGGAKQEASVFEYTVSLDGSSRESSQDANVLKAAEGEGLRAFLGAYAQFDWQAAEGLNLLAGLRFNVTREKREGEKEELGVEVRAEEEKQINRLSGMLGASWRAWSVGADGLTLYADYRNSFKSAAFEFGPEVEAEIPKAETADSYEAGAKASLADGQLEMDLSWFLQDFRNVFLLEGNDIRKTRLRGAELEVDWKLVGDLLLRGSYAWHDARFVEATINDGANDVSGNRLELAPDRIASVGFLYSPKTGLYAGSMWSYTGERFLNKRNTAPVDAYHTIDATLGYRFQGWSLSLNGSNLTDHRDPVSESEFSEILAGTSAYYRLPARSIMLNYSLEL